MRAREFIIERSLRKSHSQVLNRTFEFPSMPTANAYRIYRFGIAMADHTMTYPDGPTNNHAVVSAYTPEEEEIVRGASRQTGDKGKPIADRGSEEPSQINVISTVASYKKNRYGV